MFDKWTILLSRKVGGCPIPPKWKLLLTLLFQIKNKFLFFLVFSKRALLRKCLIPRHFIFLNYFLTFLQQIWPFILFVKIIEASLTIAWWKNEDLDIQCDGNDPPYSPDDETEFNFLSCENNDSDEFHNFNNSAIKESKFLVFWSCLLFLLRLCSTC